MFSADMAVVQTVRFFGRVDEHAFCLVAQGRINTGRGLFPGFIHEAMSWRAVS